MRITRSPNFKQCCGTAHLVRSCKRGRYCFFLLFQYDEPTHCTCLHFFLKRSPSFCGHMGPLGKVFGRSKSFGHNASRLSMSSHVGVIGFIVSPIRAMQVDNVSSVSICSPKRLFKITHASLNMRSQMPPMWEAGRGIELPVAPSSPEVIFKLLLVPFLDSSIHFFPTADKICPVVGQNRLSEPSFSSELLEHHNEQVCTQTKSHLIINCLRCQTLKTKNPSFSFCVSCQLNLYQPHVIRSNVCKRGLSGVTRFSGKSP